jgi:hypothetical protein
MDQRQGRGWPPENIGSIGGSAGSSDSICAWTYLIASRYGYTFSPQGWLTK